ncbi:kinase-like domain-containing protein, partial [Flammula alnicola]
EARVMDFIHCHTAIPVPRVHMIFERDKVFYNVMDFIPGTPLDHLYATSSPEALRDIARELSGFIQQIRSVPIVPRTTLGSWDGKPPAVGYECGAIQCFKSVAEFDAYWIKRSKLDISLPSTEHAMVVPTHGDLHGENILVEDGKIVAIIDWDTFGWYPDFWELLSVWRAGGVSKKWRGALEGVFGPLTERHLLYMTLLHSSFEEPLRYDIDESLFL